MQRLWSAEELGKRWRFCQGSRQPVSPAPDIVREPVGSSISGRTEWPSHTAQPWLCSGWERWDQAGKLGRASIHPTLSTAEGVRHLEIPISTPPLRRSEFRQGLGRSRLIIVWVRSLPTARADPAPVAHQDDATK